MNKFEGIQNFSSPEGQAIESEVAIEIEKPEMKDCENLVTDARAFQEVMKMREDDAIMAEYVRQGLVSFIGEMTEEEMHQKALKDGWPNNWDDAHPIYDSNGIHQERWKVYEFSEGLINTAAKVRNGQSLSQNETKILNVAQKLNQVIDTQFSQEDLYIRSSDYQLKILEDLVGTDQAEYLGEYSQTEGYEKLPNFGPWVDKNHLRIPTKLKNKLGERIFEYYRFIK